MSARGCPGRCAGVHLLLALLSGYPLLTCPPSLLPGVDKANALMRAFCYGMMGPFWDERRVHIDR